MIQGDQREQKQLQELAKKDQDVVLRSFCGILLRRIMDRSGQHVEKLDQDTMNNFRTSILTIWSQESNPLILRRISHVIAQCAAGGKWMNLLPLIISQDGTINDESRVSLLNLIEIIAEYCPDDILTHIKTLCSFLSTHITSTNFKIQVACARATSSCIYIYICILYHSD